MLRSRFYFVGHYHSASLQIFSYLKEHVVDVAKITHISEVDNEDDEKCVIIFSNAREALDFLAKGILPNESFCALITERDGVFKPEVLKAFETMHLKFYTPKSINKLIEDLDQFLLGNAPVLDELEFSVQLDLRKD